MNLVEYFPKLISKLAEGKKFGKMIFIEIYEFVRVLESTLEPDDLNKLFVDKREMTINRLCQEIEQHLENNPSDLGTCSKRTSIFRGRTNLSLIKLDLSSMLNSNVSVHCI